MKIDNLYSELLENIYKNGTKLEDRTGVGTISMFGEILQYNMSSGFPIISTKSVYFKAVIHELLWFISGDTNIKYLKDHNIKIWNDWADDNGDLGPVYGHQWRNNNGVDQLQYCIDQLKINPTNRRLIVNSWRPEFCAGPLRPHLTPTRKGHVKGLLDWAITKVNE